MGPPRAKKPLWKGRTVQITAVDTAKHEKTMHDAIARRAFIVFESRGSAPGDAWGDWRRAESEVVRPLCCGFVVDDQKISVETDASIFEQGPIEICVAPRRLTICGKGSVSAGSIRPSGSTQEVAFYVLDLPVAIDPSRVMARFNGCVLIIELPLQEQALTHLQPCGTKGSSLSPQA